MNDRHLRRSSSDRILGGVLGGVAKHFGWDPVLLRVIYVVVTILSVAFPGILIYLAAWIIMPLDEDVS
jgi:phage shock protein C